ncbi:hypothetical protein GCM10025883_28160 [Mobilicoccus caccae]|uniref:Sodium:neurotransmitter symporter family protein n=1 Tax=Mobilicoccus caccae TaxID=1859295 RepID=A0ABQ6IUM6_9MICO|nr:hypothetical protein GCM10025883_28160 [Mobilicoccus caccae]
MAMAEGTTVDQLEGITGVGLSFMTFPTLINEMPGGEIFGVLFFSSLVLAGLTSIISLLEVVTAAFREKFDLRRTTAVGVVGGITAVLSVAFFSTTSGLNLLDVVDKYVNEIGIVTSAIVMTLLVTYVLRRLPALQRHLNGISSIPIGAWWRVLVGVITPIALVVMLTATAIDLVRNGYDEYPRWFTDSFGWGMVAAIIVGAILFSLIPWRTDVDARSDHDDEEGPAVQAVTSGDEGAYGHPHGQHPDTTYHAGTDPDVARPPTLRRDPRRGDRPGDQHDPTDPIDDKDGRA